MFKRLLSSLRNKNQPADTAPDEPAQEREMIVAYDAHGQEMYIARNEWREKVFLPDLEKKWDDADALYTAILMGLKDAFASDLVAAAERLVDIDSNPERSHTLHGIVLMKTGQLDVAEQTLRQGIDKSGATGTLLTNLAKVFSERGEDKQADDTLWQAIQTDPNLDNGLLWWASIQRERGGDEAYIEGLRSIAAMPGSWRAQLWMARFYLEHNETDKARGLYDEVLSGGRYDSDALYMISGDLGRNGEIPLLISLVAPHYDVQKHDPMAGINLLQAYLEQDQTEQGLKLLNQLYALNFAPIKQHLDYYRQAFEEKRRQTEPVQQVAPDDVKITTLSVTQPIWHYGLCKADWLFNQKPEETAKIGFFALSKIPDGLAAQGIQREDELGRLSRAIPLYLAEAVHYWSDYAACTYFLMAEGHGPVLTGQPMVGEDIYEILPPDMKYVVTGEIGCTGEGEQRRWQIALSLWNCTTRSKQLTETEEATDAGLGNVMQELERKLLMQAGLKREHPLDAFYQRPPADALPVYLTGLGQSLMLTLLANQQVPYSEVWNERAMLDLPLNISRHWPSLTAAKIMYLSGLGKAFDYHSEALPGYQTSSLEWLRTESSQHSVIEGLSPLMWKIFGIEGEINSRSQPVAPEAQQRYEAWLQRVAEKAITG